MITLDMVENWFAYHKPEQGEPEKYERIRAAARTLVEVIVESTVPSADQTAAVRKVREAVMTANAAIACKGR